MLKILLSSATTFIAIVFLLTAGPAMSHNKVVVIPMDSGFPNGVDGDLVTCTAFGIDDSTDTYLSCVLGGGFDTTNSFQVIPEGKTMYVNHIAAIPTQVFPNPITDNQKWYLRLKVNPATGVNNIFYEIHNFNRSEHVTFSSPIMRLNSGDRLFAENLTANSFTNDLRVIVSGWMVNQ